MSGSLILELLITWPKKKAMFSSLNDFNTKNIYVSDDRSLSVVGTGTVHLDNDQ